MGRRLAVYDMDTHKSKLREFNLIEISLADKIFHITQKILRDNHIPFFPREKMDKRIHLT
jgi:hypothetical protein